MPHPGDSDQERTSTVLFVGDETAVLAFAHATCIPSQVVQVAEDQLQGAVRSITGSEPQNPEGLMPEQAVLGITSGLVLIEDDLRPALVVEPTGPIARPGTDGSGGDQFLQLLLEQGFLPTPHLNRLPGVLPGWSVLLAMGRLHAVLQPGAAWREPRRLVAGAPAAPGHRGVEDGRQQGAERAGLRRTGRFHRPAAARGPAP